MIGKTISHYKIIEKLGEGGMGVVYKAEDTKLKRTVALKFLPSKALGDEEENRFLHEAQAAAALNHLNITTIHEISEYEGDTFIVMEYVEGQDLKDKIKKGPLKINEVIDIAIQIADGLQHAHEKGIVHRDIKSDNIMVTEQGNVKIMDFGLAKMSGATMQQQSFVQGVLIHLNKKVGYFRPLKPVLKRVREMMILQEIAEALFVLTKTG